jgi:ABC-type branched-subunit amino acid transport system substrate-binding protein
MEIIMSNKFSVLIASLFLATNVSAITIGQSCALKGPASALGKEMQRGAAAYFKGGPIKLETMDDKYEPKLCIKNTNAFIAKNVDALFGYVGTPTSKACVPLAMKAKKIYFGPFTGAGFLADAKKNPYSFSVRASYDAETEKMVDAFVKKGIKKIAIFVQDDGFGAVGKSGVLKALKKHGLTLTGEGRYKRNTIAVKKGADKVIASGAEGVITVGAYKPCGAAIKYFRKKGFNAPIINISFVGSKALAKIVKGKADNVYVTQVVPNPWDKSIPIVKEYQSKVGGNFGFISLEGYITAKIFDIGVKKAGSKANNSDSLKAALETINEDLGGLKASFSPTDHRALDKTYLTKINSDGSFSYVSGL